MDKAAIRVNGNP